ncbi:amidohydrolase family protein [Microbacterium sp. LRZ72]|uniref:N-acyl-D-amino-acid deacylase family protein n=1 Tax=Microbacterium sp. LRZ72 TaxID=2942481 RepID=UPI0029AF7837|nr:amidohydrolase family protein [Microbacterium sp. LRZ72]MDX2376766.1 amidohydrolase family protein [Microbacterium sp. LRZ72]
MTATVLTGALVVDGTGAPGHRADVTIADGRIAAVDAPGTATGTTRHDLEGLVLTPGFVDLHAHSDLTRFAYPTGDTRVLQGITTEVIGNCGLSPAPTSGEGFRGAIATIDVVPSVPLSWESPAEYLDALDGLAAAWNVAPLLGHGSVRRRVMGDATHTATPADRAAMSRIVADALDAGYWGLSYGLMYAPGELSDPTELEALAATVAAADALVAVHMRAYDADGLVAAIDEILAVATTARARLQISHLRSILDPEGAALDAALSRICASVADVAADAYPYLAGHTTALQLMPSELRARGTAEILAEVRADRAALAGELRRTVHFPPDAITIVRAGEEHTPELGRTLEQLQAADPLGRDWALILLDLIDAHDAAVDAIIVGTRPDDAARVLAEPYVSVASDGVALALDHALNRPHPRSIGTFPHAMRDLLDAGFPLEAVVHKMTAQPADRLGLTSRGRIRVGAPADLVAVDPTTVRDRADYTHPLVAPVGIDRVWVAGQCVAESGHVTGRLPGVLLRRTR